MYVCLPSVICLTELGLGFALVWASEVEFRIPLIVEILSVMNSSDKVL